MWWSCPAARRIKNQHDYVEHMLKDLSARRIDRQSYALAVGGGAMLDAVGFAAAIFHRGVRQSAAPPRCWRRTIRASA